MARTCCSLWKGWLSANRVSLAPAQSSTSPPSTSCFSHSSSPTCRLSMQASVFSVTCRIPNKTQFATLTFHSDSDLRAMGFTIKSHHSSNEADVLYK